MIGRIVDYSVNHTFLVLFLVAAAALAGAWSAYHVPLDAIPDLSDTQVIVYSKWDRSPDLVEDQVTYPIVTAMLGAPKVKAVRGFSDFGYSYVYAIFEDGTDIYWARSRTLEYLSSVLSTLPQGVKTEIGPDATALGWIFQYVLVDASGKHSLAEMRAYQDWYLRYYLKSVPGVAEVAPLGGFGQQFQVIDRVKAKLKEIEPGLPAGVKVVPVYDRSDLIHRAIANLRSTLVEVLVTVSLVILLFLWHVPSAVIPLVTIPVAVLVSFIPFRAMGVTANIMSLGGIAIAIGALVDAAIVVVEQTHKKLEEWERGGRRGEYRDVIVSAVKQVGGPSFFALLVIAVSFLPVLTLEAQEGRLFKPLAYTKNFSMIIAAVLAITLDPAMRLLFTHMKNFSFRPAWLARVANAVLV